MLAVLQVVSDQLPILLTSKMSAGSPEATLMNGVEVNIGF